MWMNLNSEIFHQLKKFTSIFIRSKVNIFYSVNYNNDIILYFNTKRSHEFALEIKLFLC